MKTVLLIGLGRFGRHIARKLGELRHEVMAVDKSEERVNQVLPYVTNAQIGDSTNRAFLETLGVRDFDVCDRGRFSELARDDFSCEGARRQACGVQGGAGRPREVSFAQRGG